MNFLSICSGVECASLAFNPLGWKAIGFSEVDEFASTVLGHRFPETHNYGDLNDYKQWKLPHKPDLIVGGTPCQSFSAAGERKGMDDVRGQLTGTFFDLVEDVLPTWFVWENIPLSINPTLPTTINQVTACGYSVSWRVLNSISFGVPQRRQRVFLVGHLGDWRCAAGVLFDRPGEGWSGEENYKRNKKRLVFSPHGRGDKVSISEYAHTLRASMGTGGQNVPVVFSCGFGKPETLVEYTPTIDTACGGGKMTSPVLAGARPRYLTPEECERLMGMPAGHTRIPYKGKPEEQCPKSKRYKAIGNGICVPVLHWIGERIDFINTIKNNNK